MTQLSKYGDFSKSTTRMKDLGMDETKIKKEISFACQVINGSKQLTETTIESRMKAVINIANIGLTLNPTANEAYLIKRYYNNANQCDLEVSYRGMLKLVFQEGIVKSIKTYVVHENDHFEIGNILDCKPDHHPVFKAQGDIICVYSIAEFHDGSKQMEYLRLDDINAIKEKSESYKSFKNKKISTCPWVEWEGEMCRKSNIRRFVKHLPRGENQALLNAAIEIDNRDYQASWGKRNFIESLLSTSTYEEAQKEAIENALPAMEDERANELIQELKLNQLDVTQLGAGNVSATEYAKSYKDKVRD